MTHQFLRNALTALCLSGTCVTAQPSPLAAAPEYRTEAELIAAVMPTFVNIYNRKIVAGDPPVDGSGKAAVPRVEDDVGSGFLVSSDGLIVTNRHVIEGAYSLFVTLNDGTHVPAKLIGKALTFDIALLKIDINRPLPSVTAGDSDTLQVGQRVVAIGNPLGYSSSASTGIISALHRNGNISAYDDLIQTDATINQGNSGGPLFNMSGEVIGINQAIRTQNKGGSIGIGFSIPVNEAKFLLDNVKKNSGKPHIGWFGIIGQSFTAGMAKALGIDNGGGVIVSALSASGSAARGGLRIGDIIRTFGDKNVPDIPALNRLVAASVDLDVVVGIIRDGKVAQIPIKILPWPQELWATKLEETPRFESMSDLGVSFTPTPDPDGPVVAAVADSSIARTAGIRAGDIIRKVQTTDIRTFEDLQTLFVRFKQKKQSNVMVLLGGPNGQRWVDLSIGE